MKFMSHVLTIKSDFLHPVQFLTFALLHHNIRAYLLFGFLHENIYKISSQLNWQIFTQPDIFISINKYFVSFGLVKPCFVNF